MDSKRDVRSPAQMPEARDEWSRLIERREEPSASSRVLWIAVILALLVGGVAGYLLRLSWEPTTTVTKTVTNTIPPPAYTTSTDVQARVTFDGSTCSYSGPAEVVAGSRVRLRYTAAKDLQSAMAIISVPPGMTYEDLVRTATRDADNPPSWAVPNVVSDPMGAPHQSLTMASLSEGVWAILCGTSPATTNDMFLGTMIRSVAG